MLTLFSNPGQCLHVNLYKALVRVVDVDEDIVVLVNVPEDSVVNSGRCQGC
jgi:hypothetical protein